jgi:tetratricopeptide (TPR) repeat protein
MTKTRTSIKFLWSPASAGFTLVVAALVWMGSAPLLAQVPPVPPVPPRAPVAPVPPAPAVPYTPFDLDFHFDHGEWTGHLERLKVDMDAWKLDMDHWKAEFDAVKHDFKDLGFHYEPFNLALQAVPTPSVPPPGSARVMTFTGNSEGLYEQARGFIDRDQYQRAIDAFDRIIGSAGERADAAMYWKAYSLTKTARAPEALAVLADMQKRHPKSPWVEAARYLEAETRQASGQGVGPAGETNDEIKLLALQGMMRSDPETTLPILEKMLAGGASVRLKERALFVVSQSRTTRGRDVIAGVAKGNTNPDLQMAAIRYLGQMSTAESRQALAEIYRGSSSVDVKRAVIRALRSANALDELNAIGKIEKDPELRREIIRYMGGTNRPEAAETLRMIYTSEPTVEIKREVIRALRSNNSGAKALVDLARAEKNIDLKTEIVRQLSNMNDAVAKAYMLELLK